ncbi:MAG: hypothetical protein ORN49_01355 [Rhodobacteraceae bacterium]|nr:hypothetical protein [Paracoccaceae bacterium]
MKRHLVFTTICGLAVSACMPQANITTPPAHSSYRDMNSDRVARTVEMTVRTVTMVDGKKTEVLGYKCKAVSDEIQAEFTTPAKVIVPEFVQSPKLDYRGRPTPLRIECSNGKMSGVESIDAEEKQIRAATNAGLVGAVVTSVISGAIESRRPWAYPDLVMVSVN